MTKRILPAAALALLASATLAQTTITQHNNTFINPPGLFNAAKNGFSHIGTKAKHANLVFISGQWASDSTGNLATEDFAGQVKKTIENLKTCLAAVQLSEKDIIKLTVYIANYTPEKKLVLLRTAGPLLNMAVFPTSVIVPVPVMATHPQSLIEIEAIATR